MICSWWAQHRDLSGHGDLRRVGVVHCTLMRIAFGMKICTGCRVEWPWLIDALHNHALQDFRKHLSHLDLQGSGKDSLGAKGNVSF